MARRVFFSFHYQRDIWRANIIRNSRIVEGSSAAGFLDASLWEKTKLQGDAAIKRLIDRGLEGTTVTAVLIGAETSYRKYVDYEIEKSHEQGNGILGIYIHGLNNHLGLQDVQGLIPARLLSLGAPVYYWDRMLFGTWVEQAFLRAQHSVPTYSPPGLAGLFGYSQLPSTAQPANRIGDALSLLNAIKQSPSAEYDLLLRHLREQGKL